MENNIEEVWINIDNNIKNKLSLPCIFDYDKFWLGHHTCIECLSEVTFSESNIKKEPMYWSKIFDVKILRDIVKQINNAQIINVNGYEAIVLEDYNINFPIPISPAHYQCDHCKQSYSIIYSFGFHDSNDKFANPKSKLCTCGISQIIYPALM